MIEQPGYRKLPADKTLFHATGVTAWVRNRVAGLASERMFDRLFSYEQPVKADLNRFDYNTGLTTKRVKVSAEAAPHPQNACRKC